MNPETKRIRRDVIDEARAQYQQSGGISTKTRSRMYWFLDIPHDATDTQAMELLDEQIAKQVTQRLTK